MKNSLLDEEQLIKELENLNAHLQNTWTVENNNLSKTFVFRNFVEAFGFMAQAAIIAEKMDHHPDWSNVYKTVVVSLTTHESGGLTALDFSLASAMERICNQ